MINKWIHWINLFLIALLFVVLVFASLITFFRPKEIIFPPISSTSTSLSKSPFSFPKKMYDEIGSPLLSLTFLEPSLQLPDLRRTLVFYGKNGRPDADSKDPFLFFGFLGSQVKKAVSPHQKTYLFYDKNVSPPQYHFSPPHQETYLWFEASSQNKQAHIEVRMQGNEGQIIDQPKAFASFDLLEKEPVRYGGTAWEIGKLRVDATLLARQRAKWYGLDLFLEKHGGKEFQDLKGAHRIDFGEGQNVYSVFVKKDSVLIWSGDRWKEVIPGPDSKGYPLLLVKKIEERLMNLELWDIEGKTKVVFNLMKSTEGWPSQNLEKTFKFIGSRTRSQFVFEINKERMLLSPKDWLLFHEGKWKKLKSPKEIDDYVERKTIGPLFVLDGVWQEGDQMMILGTLFNSARSEMRPIEIPTKQNKTPSSIGSKKILNMTRKPQDTFSHLRGQPDEEEESEEEESDLDIEDDEE